MCLKANSLDRRCLQRPVLRRLSPAGLLFLSLIALGIHAQASSASVFAPQGSPSNVPQDIRSFQTRLAQIQSEPAAGTMSRESIVSLESSLPVEWIVDTPERKYYVSTAQLRALLDEAVKDPARRLERIAEARERVDELDSELSGYDSAASPRDAGARATLGRILARSEFRTDYTPSAWERLQQRARSWALQMITRLLGRLGGYPLAARMLFWILLLGAAAILALLLFRSWIRQARTAELRAPTVFVATQTWQEWIRAARSAADRANFREAIHALYWAGIVCLENSHVIPCEPSRTPRERLRHLNAAVGAVPAPGDGAVVRDRLRALTSTLERTWYADGLATRQDFLDSLHMVEELGCKRP
jgi:Domain of unknown function (DUF4129)